MKIFIFGFLVVAVSASLLESEKFKAYKSEHGKTYKNRVEETKRFNIFNANLHDIEEHNALYEKGLVSYKKAVNQFTDMTEEEFESYLTASASKRPKLNATVIVRPEGAVPVSVDWRSSGQVTMVKNQGSCGACWAFSLTGAVEAAHHRKTKRQAVLSEQQLIDCAGKPNSGCDGGHLDETYPYLEKFGLQSANSYPYLEKNSNCKYAASKVVTKVSSFFALAGEDEAGLRVAVGTIGPVSVAMQSKYLSPYSHGIYIEPRCNPKLTDHFVLAVGYGSENGVDYWIVKNSWGPNWGEKGYFRIKRGVNMCGIAEDSIYPIIN